MGICIKRLFFLILTVFVIAPASARSGMVPSDSSTVYIPKILLVPYDPLYYLSDADHDIAEQSKRAMNEVRSTFHEKSDYYVYAAISKHFTCIDLLHDTSPDVQEDLITIFSTLGYQYEEPMHVNPDVRKLKPEVQKKESYADPHTAYRYKNPEGDLKYMNAVLGKPELLKSLGSKYAVDYVVFLNQFEIKTNFNSCVDIANKVYQRTLMLHFSVYTAGGKQVAGNFAYSFFPSDSNEANEIMKNCFSSLGESITKSLTDAVYPNSAKR